MLQKTLKILECSRIFSLPMSLFSWFVIFVCGIIDSGNMLYGILSLVGISFAHLGVNVLDDYFDYKSLIKQVNFDKKEYLRNSQKTKCRYLVNGIMKEHEVLIIAGVYFLLASIIGLFLYFKCGNGVLLFATIGAFIALIYPFISKICLSEMAVGIAYGPVLFGGVFYVMTGVFDKDIFIISLPTMFMTIVLLYIHTVMDYDYDLKEGHNTIANRFNSQLDSLIVLKILLILSYVSILGLCILDIFNWQIMLTYLTIPMAIDLYKSLEAFSCNPNSIPEKKWYHVPMENYGRLLENGEASFMVRMYQSRNLMIYFSFLLVIGIIFSTTV